MNSTPLHAGKQELPTAAGAPASKASYDDIPVYVLGIFAAYMVVWFLQLGNRIHALGAVRFEFLLALALIAVSFTIPRQKLTVRCNLYAYIAWFLVALLVEIPFSYDVDYSWTVFVDRVFKFACMGFFITVFVRSPTALRFFLAAVLLAWFKMGQEGLTGQLTGSLVWENQGVMRLHGVTGNYEHPNSFSGFALGTLPFIYYLFPLSNKWGKGVLLIMLVFAITIVLYTGSRTGYIGFLLFAVWVFLKSKNKLKFMVAGLIVGIVGLQYVPQQYIDRFHSITGQEKEGHSRLRRLEILQDAVVIFSEHPFGVGVSAFPAIRQQRFGRSQDTHNLYLEVATNLGIQGFIIWSLLIFAIFRNIKRLSVDLEAQLDLLTARAPDPEAPPPWSAGLTKHISDVKLMLAMVYAVSAYIAVRLAVGLFGMDLYEIYWWFAMGIIIAMHNMAQIAGVMSKTYVELLGREPVPEKKPAR
jgi:O-antigen ligase